MSYHTFQFDLETWELAYLAFIAGYAFYLLFEDSGEPEPVTEQTARLDEERLRRLEDGETLRVHRWHGHELELRGDLVVDVASSETDASTGDQ